MKAVFLYLGLLLAYFVRQVIDPYIISGASPFVSQFIMTGLFNGLWISILTLFVVVRGKFKLSDIVTSFAFAVAFNELNGFTTIVKAYEFLYEGHLPLPYERYHVAAHNVYLVIIFACLTASLMYVRFAPNHVRKIATVPLLVIFMGCNFYHYYQFFLFTNDAWNQSRSNALTYINNEIHSDNFMAHCQAVENMICAEWKQGEPFPEEVMHPASRILQEIKDAYENNSWSTFNLIYSGQETHTGYNLFLDGQIDNTFAESLWASINILVLQDEGTYRLAVYDHIDMVHVGSVTAGIALTIASILWMALTLFLLQVHPEPKGKDPKITVLIAPLCVLAIFFLNLKPLQEYYGYALLFLVAIFMLPMKKRHWRKIALVGAVAGAHVALSWAMFTQASLVYPSVAVIIFSATLCSLWYYQADVTLKPLLPTSDSLFLVMIATATPLALATVNMIYGAQTAHTMSYAMLGMMLPTIAAMVLQLCRQDIRQKLTGADLIILITGLVAFVITTLFVLFVTPFTLEFISSTSALTFNADLMNADRFSESAILFQCYVILSVMGFLKIVHYYICRRHHNYRLYKLSKAGDEKRASKEV